MVFLLTFIVFNINDKHMVCTFKGADLFLLVGHNNEASTIKLNKKKHSSEGNKKILLLISNMRYIGYKFSKLTKK
jgi:hypothetical protein